MDPALSAPPGPAADAASLVPPTAYYSEQDLDVIKVTVDRRERNIQSYAGSASAFSEEDLERVNVNSVRNLAQATPYLEIGTREGNTEIFIRGVGGTDNTEVADPATGMYFNGVYIPRPRGVGSMFFDVERVEINRGPQGTLRGRNATAGSVNIITNKPKLGEWQSSGDIQLGNYSQKLTRAMLNIPIGDTLALRFATYSENHDPFYHNGGPVSTITPTESADNLAYRASALWAPSHWFKATVTHDLTQEKGTGFVGTNFAPALNAGLLPSEIPDPRAVIYRNPQPSLSMWHLGVGTNLQFDFGPVLAEVISSYRDMRYNQNTGSQAGVAFPGEVLPALDNWSSKYWRTTSKSTVQELRFYAPAKSRVHWTAGGFLFYEHQTAFLGNTADNVTGNAGSEFNMPRVVGLSEAGYADAIADVLERLRVTGGLRFTHEHKERTGGLVAVFNGLNTNGMPFRFGTDGFQFAEGARTIYVPNADPTQDNQNILRNGIARFGVRDTLPGLLVSANSSYTPQNGYYTDNFLDWRLGVDGDLSKQSMVYAQAATAHHSGGFNDTINTPSGKLIAPTYRPEQLYSLEVGSKNKILNNKLTVNASAFGYLYRDQQFSGPQALEAFRDPNNPTLAPPTTLLRFNAAKSHILGLEVDGSYKLPFGFVLGVQAEFLDAKFDEGVIADSRLGSSVATEPSVNLKGHKLPRTPLATVNYGLAQNITTTFGYFDWLVAAQTRTSYYMTVFNGDGRDAAGNVVPFLSDRQPTYTRLDASVGYTRLDGKMRLELLGSNLTDVAYITTLNIAPNTNTRLFNPPRQYGIRMQLFW